MDCDRYLDLLSAAVDGSLSLEEQRALKAHLARCPSCTRLLEQLQAQSQILRTVEDVPPADLSARILSQLPAQKKRGLAVSWRRWGALAACAALALGLGIAHPWAHAPGSDAPQPAEYRTTNPDGNQNPLPQDRCVVSYAQPQVFSLSALPAVPAAVVVDQFSQLEQLLAHCAPQSVLEALAACYPSAYFEEGGLLLAVTACAPSAPALEQLTAHSAVLTPGSLQGEGSAWLLVAQVGQPFQGGQVLTLTADP